MQGTKSEKNISLSKILSEVYFQIKAEHLKEVCRYKTSKIIQYGLLNPRNDIFYILYDKLSGLTPLTKLLDNKDCSKIMDRVREVNNCLKANELYHNDLTTLDNILVDSNNNLYIIDYGEASENITMFDNLDNMYSKCSRVSSNQIKSELKSKSK